MSTLIMGIACVNVKFFQHKVQTQVNSEVVPEDTAEGKSHSAAANQSPDIEATTEVCTEFTFVMPRIANKANLFVTSL